METKQVIIVRKDLNMRKGKIASQVAHASMGALLKNSVNSSKNIYGEVYTKILLDEDLKHWLEHSFTKIVVSVDSEEELLAIRDQVERDCVRHCLIQDNGKTEFNGIPTYTTLAIGPAEVDRINRYTKDLRLL